MVTLIQILVSKEVDFQKLNAVRPCGHDPEISSSSCVLACDICSTPTGCHTGFMVNGIFVCPDELEKLLADRSFESDADLQKLKPRAALKSQPLNLTKTRIVQSESFNTNAGKWLAGKISEQTRNVLEGLQKAEQNNHASSQTIYDRMVTTHLDPQKPNHVKSVLLNVWIPIKNESRLLSPSLSLAEPVSVYKDQVVLMNPDCLDVVPLGIALAREKFSLKLWPLQAIALLLQTQDQNDTVLAISDKIGEALDKCSDLIKDIVPYISAARLGCVSADVSTMHDDINEVVNSLVNLDYKMLATEIKNNRVPARNAYAEAEADGSSTGSRLRIHQDLKKWHTLSEFITSKYSQSVPTKERHKAVVTSYIEDLSGGELWAELRRKLQTLWVLCNKRFDQDPFLTPAAFNHLVNMKYTRDSDANLRYKLGMRSAISVSNGKEPGRHHIAMACGLTELVPNSTASFDPARLTIATQLIWSNKMITNATQAEIDDFHAYILAHAARQYGPTFLPGFKFKLKR